MRKIKSFESKTKKEKERKKKYVAVPSDLDFVGYLCNYCA